MAKISIIVPFYKVPYEYMHQCLESILEQTFPDIEVILVDDGSPDDCGKICDEYQLLDERVVVIHKKMAAYPMPEMPVLQRQLLNGLHLWMVMIGLRKISVSILLEELRKKKNSRYLLFFRFRNYPSKVMEGVPHFADGTRFEDYKEREILQSKCFTIHLEKNGNRKGITISSAWAKCTGRII